MGWVYFSPYDDCEARIIERIDAATEYVAGLIYKYESGPIHTALLNAQARTGYVYLIFDRRQQFLEDTRFAELVDAGAIVLLDKFCRQVRSQYLMIDGTHTLSGSYLYTHTFRDHYASTIDFVTGGSELDLYSADWNYHYEHSELWT